MSPPCHAVVLSIDEKSQIAAAKKKGITDSRATIARKMKEKEVSAVRPRRHKPHPLVRR
jgi:hypothetical protein